MYELTKKKIGKVLVFTSKLFGTGPSSYEKRIYRAAVSQRLRNTGIHHPNFNHLVLHPKLSVCNFLLPLLRLDVIFQAFCELKQRWSS